MSLVNFFKFEECGAVVLGMGDDSPNCSGEKMQLLKANTTDASAEKHVPIVTQENGIVMVRVGSAPHPMTPEHYIQWIFVKTTYGGVYCDLSHEDSPEAAFQFAQGEVVSVYAYCNLHGLWKATEPVLPTPFETNDDACSMEFSAGCVNHSAD